jgi:CHAT domain-containing protein
VAGQVPPATLLEEMPPVLGAGYDLRSARWLIREHSFVRTSSIDAFVATKKLSKTKRATLDYLGVGDPVLSGGTLAARDGLGALPQLPETSEEVERVASLFCQRFACCGSEAATEEAFRLEPCRNSMSFIWRRMVSSRKKLLGFARASRYSPLPQGRCLQRRALTACRSRRCRRARLVVLSACNSARYEPSIIDSGIRVSRRRSPSRVLDDARCGRSKARSRAI